MCLCFAQVSQDIKLHILMFIIYMRIFNSFDHELGTHKSAENQIYRVGNIFDMFHIFLKIDEDLLHETKPRMCVIVYHLFMCAPFT